MPNQTRPWLPTSPRETALVFALNLTLMASLTVAALLVSGDLPTLHASTNGGAEDLGALAASTAGPDEPGDAGGSDQTLHTGSADERSTTTDAADPAPAEPQASAEPKPAATAAEPVAPTRSADEQAGAEASSAKASEPEDEDEPVTFFDIPVE